ncbi:hypothetical protein KAR91_38510, partial [Candidatus Pacearchaeota archaeon]|nr:hypothetical protein [Candidatus Pacearchaeota archaeon]
MFNIKISRAIFKLLIIAQIVIVSSQIQAEITVAVLNFANRATGVEQQKYNWLEKGLTDLIINDLSSYEGFRVVTREHMQMLMEEREILNTLSLPNDVRRSIGRSLQVDYLVFGTFGVDKNGLVLEAKVINVDDSRVIASLTEQSSLDQVLIMEKNLAGDLIVCLKGKGVSQNIVHQLPRWTDSVPATEYLYNGVDYFDKGLYTKAWYYFRKAIHNDPNFADARYWLARMSYYRQEYGHARVEYEQFVNNFPSHPRIGDAIIEFVHSYERTIDDPDTLLKFYQEARKQDWGGNRVYHQADYINWSPLYDWLIKREQQTLKFKHEYGEAFSLLLSGIEYNIPVYERGLEHRLRSWQNESVRLMASAAVESEDRFNRRLTSTYLPYKDIALSVNMPRAGKDIAKKEGLCGGVYKWGCNYRILAPEGFSIKKIKATVMRTNDPKHDAVCRLQIRRYRYVDIDSVWTTNKTKPEDLTRTITMPPGCTWFYLRPEYLSRAYRIGISQVKNIKSSFDGWRIEAELEPLGPVGRIGITVDNCSRYEVLVDGVYARCFDGIITNLIPGKHKIEVRHTHNSAYLPQEKEVEIKADEIISLELSLPFKHEVKEEGWQNPTSVARQYPWFKHRPARVARLGRSRESALRGIRPTICRTRSGVFVVIWSFLDDLWMATSKDGKKWNVPVNISPPVNSAHV